MSDDEGGAVHSFVRADPPVEVDIVGPRGTFRGVATGWTGARVHVRWTEGVGESYVQTVASSQVRRVV